MSEKKTAEIKLRIEPSVKAQWQQSAADEGIGLSEFVVKAVTQYRGMSSRFVPGTHTTLYTAVAGSTAPYVHPTAGQFQNVTVTISPVPANTGEKKFGEDWKPWS